MRAKNEAYRISHMPNGVMPNFPTTRLRGGVDRVLRFTLVATQILTTDRFSLPTPPPNNCSNCSSLTFNLTSQCINSRLAPQQTTDSFAPSAAPSATPSVAPSSTPTSAPSASPTSAPASLRNDASSDRASAAVVGSAVLLAAAVMALLA